MMEPCTPEEDAIFGQMSAWCYKHRVQIFQKDNRREAGDLVTRPKPKKRQKPSWEKQAERAAIDKLLSTSAAGTLVPLDQTVDNTVDGFLHRE